jgi:hypothetical protein
MTLASGAGILAILLAVFVFTAGAQAQTTTPAEDFSLQLTPSPMVATLKPGTETTLELKIRNAGTGQERLKIEPRKFNINNETGEVDLSDTEPSEIAPWIRFSEPQFTINSGQWYTQKIRISLPENTGFSYSLALVISRTNDPQATAGGRVIKGSVANFLLINVDRPGATRKLEVEKFETTSGVYEYLPVSMNIRFKNSGNTIVQPYGNVFVQQGSNSQPLATLPVNDKRGYILPGSNRVLTAQWTSGFPYLETTTDNVGDQRTTEVWDWSKMNDFKMGNYTAKLVAVYNDGLRDVPIEKEVSFWVLPWKIILGVIIVSAVFIFGVWSILRKIWSIIRRGKREVQ